MQENTMTAAEVKMEKIVILWDADLRKAAKALHRLTDKNCSAEDAENALKACFAAIYHPLLVEDAPLVIMSAQHYKKGGDSTDMNRVGRSTSEPKLPAEKERVE